MTLPEISSIILGLVLLVPFSFWLFVSDTPTSQVVMKAKLKGAIQLTVVVGTLVILLLPGLKGYLDRAMPGFDEQTRGILFAPLKAALVGTLAAAAYYLSVVLGFLDAGNDAFLSLLQGSRLGRLQYFLFGGFIAGLVQLTTPDRYAPIQALVLGATWPSFLAKQMGGKSDSSDHRATVEALKSGTDPANIEARL